MRLLHSSDVHLGRAFGYLGARASEHQARLKRTFQRIFQLAQEHDCDAILIAGDLFDSPQVSREWVEFALRTIGSTRLPTVVIPGNHDPAERHPFRNHTLPVNLHFLDETARYRVPALDLEIRACPAGQEARWSAVLNHDPDGAPYQIAIMHGSMPHPDGKGTIPIELLAVSQLHYVALGDWHSPRHFQLGATPCWYSGAPEMVMPNQSLPGSVLIVELDEGRPAQVKPVPCGEAVYPKNTNGMLDVDVALYAELNLLVSAIRARLGENVVARVRLVGQWSGQVPLHPHEVAEALRDACLWLEVEGAFQHETLQPETPFEQVLAEVVASKPNREQLQPAYQLALYLLRGGRL